jgi:hypothetical protein
MRDVITLKLCISHRIMHRSESLKHEIEVVRDIKLTPFCNTGTDFYFKFYPFIPFRKIGNSRRTALSFASSDLMESRTGLASAMK